MKGGGNASGLVELVENHPHGRVDLYAQGKDVNPPTERQPLKVRVSKGCSRPEFFETGQDYKIREKVPDDIHEVQQAKHRIVGYTGHIHGQQHIYAKSYRVSHLHGGADNLTEPWTPAGPSCCE